MSLDADRDQATPWNVILGAGRDWSRTVTFLDDAGDPYPVDAVDVVAQVRRATPVDITVAQGAASNVVVLAVTAAELGDGSFVRPWRVDVDGRRWFAGTWEVTSSPGEPDDDEYTVTVGDDVDLTAVVSVTTVSIGGEGGADDQTASEVPFAPAGNVEATDVQAAIVENDAAITAEAVTRAAADAALSDLISTEQTVRADADSAEETARTNADTALDGRLDTIEADYLQAADIAGKANTADLADVATSGEYTDLLNTPTLGTAAATDATAYATAAQGALADSALQNATDVIGVFTGVPDGTKFLRDDGTLATPAGGAGGVPIDATGLAAGDDIITGDNATIEESEDGTFRIVSTAAASTPLIVRNAASQTVPTVELQTSAGAVFGTLSDSGSGRLHVAGGSGTHPHLDLGTSGDARDIHLACSSGGTVELHYHDNGPYLTISAGGVDIAPVTGGVSITPASGQGVGFFGVTQATQAVNAGTASGTDAAVINAIVTALVNYGLMAA